MNFKDSAMAQIELLQRLIRVEKEQLATLPQGRLIRKRAKGKTYYYAEEKGQLTSLLHKRKRKESYILKEQLERRIHNAEEDIPILEKLVNSYLPIIGTDAQWNNIRPAQDDFMGEDKIHLYKGIYYRSKSELLIAVVLDSYKIKYKYEVRTDANGQKPRSDFYVKRPKDKKIFIWEHFGLTTEERYLKKVYSKLENYHYQGIDLWDNLLISFDQEDGGIDVDTIDKMIKLFLL